MYPVIFELPNWFPFLGGAPITSFGVFMLLSFLTGGYVLQVEMRRMGQDPEQAWDLVFWAVVGGIVGAKGYYILLNYPLLLSSRLNSLPRRSRLVRWLPACNSSCSVANP